jgi:hypothetical protein
MEKHREASAGCRSLVSPATFRNRPGAQGGCCQLFAIAALPAFRGTVAAAGSRRRFGILVSAKS